MSVLREALDKQIAESGIEPTKAHHPVGAYYPVGQLDGDCSCGRGEWPCAFLTGEQR